MKNNEIRDLTAEELQTRLLDTQKELFNLRIQKSAGQVEKPSRIRDLRRDIARVKTAMRKRVLAQEKT